MNLLEEAVVYAAVMRQGKAPRFKGNRFMLHPLEVEQILHQMGAEGCPSVKKVPQPE